MPASTDLREGMAEAFDALADEFQNGVTVTLQKASATTDAFEDLLVVTSKRFFEYSNFRKNTLLEIADTSGALTTAMASATHVEIGSDVYVILQGDTLPPAGVNPVWRIYLELFQQRGHYTEL